ncbi:transposable element Tcb1 transposase [Trichonephila clavipes]|nr:transposable element Tcb1 transposase [Trichonephila clavipes]
MHHYTVPASRIMAWGGTGFHFRTSLVRIDGTLNRQCYISEVLKPVVLLYIQHLPLAIFQQDNARPHVTCNVQVFFFTNQIELIPWPTPDLWAIENVWSMLAQQLAPAGTPDLLWRYVEAAWTAVPQEYIQRLFTSMPRRVAAVIANNGGCTDY